MFTVRPTPADPLLERSVAIGFGCIVVAPLRAAVRFIGRGRSIRSGEAGAVWLFSDREIRGDGVVLATVERGVSLRGLRMAICSVGLEAAF